MQWETALQTARSEKEEGRGAPVTGAEIGALETLEKTMVKHIEPAAHGGPCWNRYPPCSPWRIHWRRWRCLEGSSWRSHAGAGVCQELQPVERSPCRSRFSDRSCGSVEWSLPEGLGPVEKTPTRAAHEELQLGEEHRSSL